MNDLAEKALQGLDVARREVRSHPMLSFGVLGLLVSTVVVISGGQVGSGRATRPLSRWLHLQDRKGLPSGDVVPGVIMLVAVVALVALWFAVAEFVRRAPTPEARVWWVAAAWAAPFAIGPPLMDTTVHSYAAFGLLQRDGHNPYHFGPVRLGGAPVVAAIDPGARGTPSSVGPLGTLLQHLSVSIGSGSALAAVIVLRVLGVLVAIWIGRLAADMAGSRRSRALSLTVLNPLVLLYVVSSPHLDGLMVALVLAALSAANLRRWPAAVVLGCLAGSVSAQGFVVVPIVIAVHCLGQRPAVMARVIGRDVLIAAATTCAIGFAVPGGFGWLSTVSKQFSAHTPFSVSGAIGKALTPIVRGASYDDLAVGGRITAITAMVCIICYLIFTAGNRAIERTAGYALLAMALLAPVLYPWYLLWGTLCLAPTANGARRIAVLALCGAACVLIPPGFSTWTSDVITAAALVVWAGAASVVLVRHQRSRAAQVISAES